MLNVNKTQYRLLLVCGLFGAFCGLEATAGISGAFIQISPYMADYTQQDWDQEIALMHDAGLDTVIISPAIADGKAHYPSELDFVTEVTDHGLVMIMNACSSRGMHVLVGLVNDNRWWTSVGNSQVLASMAANNIAAADELLPLVSGQSSFAGWYMTEEMVFNVWGTGSARTSLINTLLNPVVNHLKSITPDKPVATAPFIANINSGAAACGQWWDDVLGQVDFDIVMLQDGFGANANRRPEQMVPYFRELSAACRNRGVEFWNDLEVFNQTDWSARTYRDAKTQITISRDHVDKIVIFDWFYITPTQRMRGTQRTADRQNFYVHMRADNRHLELASLNKRYNLSRTPSPTYPDVKHQLTDSQIDFLMDSQVGFYLSGFGGGQTTVSVTVDLRENMMSQYGFAATLMNRPSWGAHLPQSVKVAVSQNGDDFVPVADLETYPFGGDSLNVYFAFPPQFIAARYVRFTFQSSGWLMCSEVSVFRGAPAGDLNRDGKVDMEDLSCLVQRWLKTEGDRSGFSYTDFSVLAQSWNWQRDRKQHFRDTFLTLQSVQLSQGSPYMQNRSLESIASELAVNDVESVFVMATSVNNFRTGIVQALHDRDIGAGLMLFADSVYTPLSEFPPGWEDWKVEFLNGPSYTHLSFIHDGYRQWMKQRAVNLCNTHDFDAVTFAEPMYPVYDGITRTPVQYADVSQAYQDRFKADTGETSFPNFTDPGHPDYFKTNTSLYQKLVQHRIDSVTYFFDEIINGPQGLRQESPDTMVITWSLACSKLANGGVDVLPEWEGNDAYRIVKTVKPDMHYFQTHWPDWVDPTISPERIYQYIQNFNEVWRAAPAVAIGVQDDIGSHDNMRRSNAYYERFLAACRASGVAHSTYYCFSLRADVYDAAPQLKRIRQGKTDDAIADRTVGVRSAAIGRFADAEGKLNIRIHTKDKLPGNWIFISELIVNGQMGGFTYTLSSQTPPYSGRPDVTGNDLANGRVAQLNFDDPDWVQWAPNVQGKPPYVDMTLHLEPGTWVETIGLHSMRYESTHVYPPERIEIGGIEYMLRNLNTIDLEFNQRIHHNSAALMVQRVISTDSGSVFQPVVATVDGNLLKLTLEAPVQAGQVLTVDVGGISDDPSFRWTTPNIAPGAMNITPDGTAVQRAVESNP